MSRFQILDGGTLLRRDRRRLLRPWSRRSRPERPAGRGGWPRAPARSASSSPARNAAATSVKRRLCRREYSRSKENASSRSTPGPFGQPALGLLEGDPAVERSLELVGQDGGLADGPFLEDPDGGDVGHRLTQQHVGGVEPAVLGVEEVDRSDDLAPDAQRQGVGGDESRRRRFGGEPWPTTRRVAQRAGSRPARRCGSSRGRALPRSGARRAPESWSARTTTPCTAGSPRVGQHQPGFHRPEQLDAPLGEQGEEVDHVELVDQGVGQLHQRRGQPLLTAAVHARPEQTRTSHVQNLPEASKISDGATRVWSGADAHRFDCERQHQFSSLGGSLERGSAVHAKVRPASVPPRWTARRSACSSTRARSRGSRRRRRWRPDGRLCATGPSGEPPRRPASPGPGAGDSRRGSRGGAPTTSKRGSASPARCP